MPDNYTKKLATENNPAVVTPLDEHMGLDIARSLGRRGIPVFGIDPDPEAAGRVSKYCKHVLCPDSLVAQSDYVQFLIDWGRTQKRKVVLFPVSDETVLLCSRERQSLQPYFEMVMPEHMTMERLASKGGLVSAATECGIPAPQTIIPENLQAVQEAARTLSFPVIIKPIEASYWHTPDIVQLLRKNALSGRVKVVVCHSDEQLIQLYRNIAVYDARMIIQELIPGPDENLAYISFYLDRSSRPLAIFAGRKLRVIPIGFGSASYVRSFQDSELEKVAKQLLIGVKYQGLGGIEFKKDIRDGRYKLIEFNTRFGMWDGLGVRCGVDTPYIAYQDTLGRPVEPQLTYKSDVIWVDLQRDVRAFWNYHQQGSLTLGQWLRSLHGEKMWAIYSWADSRPGIVFSYNLLRLLWTRLTNNRASSQNRLNRLGDKE